MGLLTKRPVVNDLSSERGAFHGAPRPFDHLKSFGATITIVGQGRCTIVASQGGNDYYDAAKPVTQNVQL